MSTLTRYLSVKRSALFMIIGLVVFLIYLYFYIGISKILKVLSSVNTTQYAVFYSLALATVLVSVFFWSAAWNSILKCLSVNITYRRAYLYYWVGYFVDLVIPCATVCGEVTRLYLVKKQTRKKYGVLAACAITNRIVAYTIVTIGLYSGAILIFLKPSISPIISNVFLVFLTGVTIYLAVLLYLAFAKHAARDFSKLYVKIMRTLRPRSYQLGKEEQTRESLACYYAGFKTFREKPKLLAKPLIFHLISYLLGLSVYILIFYALGIPVANPEVYIVVFFIATAVQDAAASFSVGSLEIVLTSILLLYGLNSAVSGITALLLRSAGFWFPLFVGFVCVQIMGAGNLISDSFQYSSRRKQKGSTPKKESISFRGNHFY